MKKLIYAVLCLALVTAVSAMGWKIQDARTPVVKSVGNSSVFVTKNAATLKVNAKTQDIPDAAHPNAEMK